MDVVIITFGAKKSKMIPSPVKRFFIRTDAQYETFVQKFQPQKTGTRIMYLLLYLLPGMVAYVLINVQPVYEWLIRLTGISGNYFQYLVLIFITYVWHMCLPLAILRWNDQLTWKETLDFLSLSRWDWKGTTYLQLVFFILFTLVTLPYMVYIQRPMYEWLDSIEIFSIPSYSIFKSAEALYGFPPVLLFFLFIGNFIGEEVYYRGYLLKKTQFLGKHNVWINGALFALYHFFQIPQTWPLIIPGMVFPLIMSWRKNLWVAIIFHFLVNLIWAPLVAVVLSLIG